MSDPRFPLSTQSNQFTTAASTTASNLLGQKEFLSGEAVAPIRSTATAPSPGFIQQPSLLPAEKSLPLQSSFENSTLGVTSSTSNLPLNSGFTGTTTTTTGLGAPPLNSAPLVNAPLTTTRESHPSARETVITKETVIPAVYGAGAAIAAPAAAWREAPVITNFQERPIITEVIEKPSLEIHRQQHITEIHEKPQVVFQEQPLIVQERHPAQYRKVTEQILTEDRREAALPVVNPYLNVQPHFVREAEIRSEIAEAAVVKQVIEKPSVEVHQQPIVTEVIEKPAVEIHEQEVIRKFRDAPTVMRSTSPVQYISVEQARAMGIAIPPPALLEGAPRLEAPVLLPAQQQVFVQQPRVDLIKPATVVTEEVHTLTHPVGRAHIPLGAEIVSTTDPNLKPEVGFAHGNAATMPATTTQASPGVMGRVKNALGLGAKHQNNTGYY